MLAVYTVLGTSSVLLLFGIVSLIVLWNEVGYRKKCLQIIGVSVLVPILYAVLVLALACCEYPLG